MSKCDVKRGQEFYSMWLLGGLGTCSLDGLRLLLVHSQHVSTYSQ